MIEKGPQQIPPVYNIRTAPSKSPLRRFIALQDETLLVLGPRRIPSVVCPASNTNSAISILTSVGFRQLESAEYAMAAKKLRPDIVVGLGDFVTHQRSSLQRVGKMGDRTSSWLRRMFEEIWSDRAANGIKSERDEMERGDGHEGTLTKEGEEMSPAIFAPILPISIEEQSFYIDDILETFREGVSGLVIHDASTVSELPSALHDLPRLSLDETMAVTPHEIARQIALGIDLVPNAFVNIATDAGIALDFTFPCPSAAVGRPTKDKAGLEAEEEVSKSISTKNEHSRLLDPAEAREYSVKEDYIRRQKPLGFNMWLARDSNDLSKATNNVHLSRDLSTDRSPITVSCECYTCSHHHRAYIHHLLLSNEMLGWVLLQLHNLHVLDRFFLDIRRSIERGLFELDRRRFAEEYESELPRKTGTGPRYFCSILLLRCSPPLSPASPLSTLFVGVPLISFSISSVLPPYPNTESSFTSFPFLYSESKLHHIPRLSSPFLIWFPSSRFWTKGLPLSTPYVK